MWLASALVVYFMGLAKDLKEHIKAFGLDFEKLLIIEVLLRQVELILQLEPQQFLQDLDQAE